MVSIQPLPAETPPPVAESEHVSTATYQSKGKRRKKAKSTKPRRKKPQDDDETCYRHLPISLKRKSCESRTVGGDELRKKRRAIIDREADKEANDNNFIERLESNDFIVEVSMDSLSIDNVHISGNIDVESSQEEIYNFLGLSWPPTRLLHLSEGMFLQDLRLKELKFKLSPTQIQTPADGNCMMWALFDQLKYTSNLKTFASDQEDFRRKIVTIGFDLFIDTERLEWQYDPEIGLPEEWKSTMLENGNFGDEIFLQLTCNVLNRDIVIIPAFKDQAHVSALGFTITKSSTPNNKEPLFLLSLNPDFPPHNTSQFVQKKIV